MIFLLQYHLTDFSALVVGAVVPSQIKLKQEKYSNEFMCFNHLVDLFKSEHFD